ncbi:MAG TPA: hypothetical protein VNX25_03475 [Verrucomicrobiae bacterium]|nr:hypothetical protein [Verrucomicrobiae bacterium]
MAEQMLKDKDYDLISVIYNAFQAAEICSQYMQDADMEGDTEARQFFDQVRRNNMDLVQRGKNLLKSRLQ